MMLKMSEAGWKGLSWVLVVWYNYVAVGEVAVVVSYGRRLRGLVNIPWRTSSLNEPPSLQGITNPSTPK